MVSDYSPKILTVRNVDRALHAWMEAFPRPLVDLSRLQRFDAYAVALLLLLGRWVRASNGILRLLLPERREVLESLASTGIFGVLSGGYWTDRPLPGAVGREGRFTILEVEDEEGINSLVDSIGDRLEARFPFGKSANRIIVKGVFELLQNILHHAGVGLEGRPLFGFAVLEEAEDHLHLAVVDQGVGLAGSLRSNPRYHGVTTAEALELVLVEGASRFDDPGRGGTLRTIRETVRANAGRMYLRSGDGAFLQEDVEWDVGKVPEFPGVQISIMLPRYLFERGGD